MIMSMCLALLSSTMVLAGMDPVTVGRTSRPSSRIERATASKNLRMFASLFARRLSRYSAGARYSVALGTAGTESSWISLPNAFANARA